MNNSLADAVIEAVMELERLAKRRPSLANSCAVLREILPTLFSEPPNELAPALDADRCRDKLATGIPLLRGENLSLDAKAFKKRWLAVCRALERQNPAARTIADSFAALNPQNLLVEVLAGRLDSVRATVENFQLDLAVTTVLRLTAFPALAQIATQLERSRQKAHWHQGCCPTCGSWPLLGEFRGLEQTRFLRCGLCSSEWQFARLRCPFCDNRDHKSLGYIQIEGEEARYRAATCNACNGYVKMAFSFAAFSAPQILVTDLATMHLDLAAANKGYWVA